MFGNENTCRKANMYKMFLPSLSVYGSILKGKTLLRRSKFFRFRVHPISKPSCCINKEIGSQKMSPFF